MHVPSEIERQRDTDAEKCELEKYRANENVTIKPRKNRKRIVKIVEKLFYLWSCAAAHTFLQHIKWMLSSFVAVAVVY